MGMGREINWDVLINSDGTASFLVYLQVLGAIKTLQLQVKWYVLTLNSNFLASSARCCRFIFPCSGKMLGVNT